MSFSNKDFILREIERLTQSIAKIFSVEVNHKAYDHPISITESADILAIQLRELLDFSEVCKAEDLLFAFCEENPTEESFRLAMKFYAELNEYTDEELEEFDFSRDEIAQGINDIKKIFENYK